jgi:hypothetical protein
MGMLSLENGASGDEGSIILFRYKSSAILKAIDMYAEVSSSAQCSPAGIHGMLTINARTISTDLNRFVMTKSASFCRCLESRLCRASKEGENRADAAHIDVNRKAERPLTKSTVCRTGSIPHLV